jgi:hypothetical protein
MQCAGQELRAEPLFFFAMLASAVYNRAVRQAARLGGRGDLKWLATMRLKSNCIVGLVITVAAAALVSPAGGEVFVLKSGGRVEGEFLNPEREPGSAFELRTDGGLRLSLGEELVHRVIVKTDVEKEYEAELLKMGNTVDDHWAMAEWCKDAGLVTLRKRHLTEMIRLEPDHKEARTALGHSLYGSKWMTQEEFLTSRGYVRYKGAWWTKQHRDLDLVAEKVEKSEKEWRRDIRIWLDQLGTRRNEFAVTNLDAIRDKTAAPALAEILADREAPRAQRLMCLQLLGKLPPGLANGVLVKLALEETDDSLRDKCLDELERAGPHLVLAAFLNELKNEKESPGSKNARINRAAYCLQRFGDPDATLPLINALATEHYVIVNPDAAGGGTPINFNAGGPVGQNGTPGGLGGLSMGSKAKKVKGKVNNPAVLSALTSMHPGVNFQYDIDEWKRWYIQNYTSTNVDLRRGE